MRPKLRLLGEVIDLVAAASLSAAERANVCVQAVGIDAQIRNGRILILGAWPPARCEDPLGVAAKTPLLADEKFPVPPARVRDVKANRRDGEHERRLVLDGFGRPF